MEDGDELHVQQALALRLLRGAVARVLLVLDPVLVLPVVVVPQLAEVTLSYHEFLVLLRLRSPQVVRQEQILLLLLLVEGEQD